jgi:hypothetical protein
MPQVSSLFTGCPRTPNRQAVPPTRCLSAAPAEIHSHALLTGMHTVAGLSMGLITASAPPPGPLLTAGQIHPAVAAELPLNQAAEAYALPASRSNLGKITLVP